MNHTHILGGLLGWENIGTIDGFIINYKEIVYGTQVYSLIDKSYGTIKNGYIYGKSVQNDITASSNNAYTPCVRVNNAGATIENVYILNSTKISTENGSSTLEANFTVYNYGIVRNVYSVDLNKDSTVSRGPNTCLNLASVENSYYFSDKIFNNSRDIKSSELALYDVEFQNQVINSENRFNTEELIKQGYFPQLNFDNCMPQQEYIKLPETTDEDLADITSIEVLEKTNNTAKLRIIVNNKNAENITDIKIDNLTCTIESQEYNDGKSEVIANINNPIIYTSEYEIISITTKGVMNNEYTREYKSGERKLYVDFYKEISNISDWEEIQKSPTENYILNQDLDFMNQGQNIIITNTFSGKLNGNNHVIRNIQVPDNYKAVFYTLSGSISNLTIENYSQNIINGNDNFGFISNGNSTSIIDNVHIKNANIYKEDSTEVVFGTILGQGSYTTIRNSSVTNSRINISKYIEAATIGGILGKNISSNIENSFVQNLDIDVTNALTLKGIGGIVGVTDAGTVINCYSTGTINANKEYVGGIVGYNSNTIQKCFSIMNIETTTGYVGGIVGYNTYYSGDTAREIPVKYNLYLGNIYTRASITNRISGNGTIGKNNYGYVNQKIAGIDIVSEDVELLNYSDIFDKNTYISTLLWDDSYDYSELGNNILPKLKNNTTGERITNQEDIQLLEEILKIQNIEIQKISNNLAEIRLEISNVNNLYISKITIDGLESSIIRNENRNGITYINMQVTPTKYWDSYKLSEIWYAENNENKEVKTQEQINVQFFKEINSYTDWQSIDESSAENYMLMTDLDLSGREVKSNVSIGRLEGNNHVIKNINITVDNSGGLIKELNGSLKNIIFSNINITNNTAGNYTGVIVNLSGEVKNVKFMDIVIDAPKRNYVACIANNVSNKINNIELKNIEVTGISYVGSFITSTNENDITNINADNITITATGNYAGGIIGYAKWSNYQIEQKIKNILIQNSNITGQDYVGGVLGYGRINYMEGINNHIKGKNDVGGITGYAYTNNGNSTTRNSIIEGTGDRIGGIAGHHNSLFNVHVYDSKIYGTGANSNYVGGIGGFGDADVGYGLVENCDISTSGSYVGGINGYRGAYESAVINTNIEGYSEVGGISGRIESYRSVIKNTYVNAEINGIAHSVGGIVGYINNAYDSDAQSSAVRLSGVYNSSISGKTNVGGLIGRTDTDVSTTQYYGNYVHATVSGDKSTSSLGIGANPTYNLSIINLYIYKYSDINGENPNEQNELFIPTNNYLNTEELRDTTTYTSKLGWAKGIWDFSVLTNNQYPILTSIGEQQAVLLPADEEISSTELQAHNLNEELEQTFEYANKEIETYSTYSLITSEDGSQVTRDTKLYVKDNNLYVVPTTLSGATATEENIVPIANNLILDNYNGKEYETVLGSDGKMYDLKESITYPENFVNENIESIGNNLNSDSHEVEVTYKNGDKIKFNYQTGEVISSSESETSDKIGLFDYIKDKVSEIGDGSSSELSAEISNKYEESKELQSKLEETSVEEALEEQNIGNSEQSENIGTATENDETNNSITENKYISIYNEKTGEYEIYNEEELLDTSKEEVVSENEKIEANNLSEYYASEGETKNTRMGIVWIVLSIIGVGIILFVLGKKIGIRGRSSKSPFKKKA